VLAVLRKTTARDLARRTGLAEWRVSRVLAGVARPTTEELRALQLALFDDGATPTAVTVSVTTPKDGEA
jgi:hypothetical protein